MLAAAGDRQPVREHRVRRWRAAPVPGRKLIVPVDRCVSARGDDAIAGLVSINTAVMRWAADRTADIRAVFQGCDAGGKCCSRTAAGAAWRAAGIPGVAGRAVQGIVGLPVGKQHRYIRFAPDGCSGIQQTLDYDCVPCGEIAFAVFEAPSGRQAGVVVRFLYRHRNAGERSCRVTAPDRAVRGTSHLACGRQISDNDSIELRM